MKNNLTVLNVYKKNSLRSEVVTQLLYGDTFKKVKRLGSWIKIKNDIDNYKGYIKTKKFFPNQKNTHKVFVLSSKLYSKPNNRNKISKRLSYGSKINVNKKKR